MFTHQNLLSFFSHYVTWDCRYRLSCLQMLPFLSTYNIFQISFYSLKKYVNFIVGTKFSPKIIWSNNREEKKEYVLMMITWVRNKSCCLHPNWVL